MASDPALKAGDVVTLKSGGPKMTITEISEDGKTANVSWSAAPFEYVNASTYALAALAPAPADAPTK